MALVEFSMLNFPVKDRIQAAQEVYAAMAKIEIQALNKTTNYSITHGLQLAAMNLHLQFMR